MPRNLNIYFSPLAIFLDVWVSMKLVLKISGKLVNPEEPEYISKLAGVVKSLVSEGHRVAVVVGGGSIARKYIDACRSLGGSEGICDLVGIDASRLNALLLIIALGDVAYRRVIRNIDELLDAWGTGLVVAAGGFQPGQSTVAVSAIIAETISADLLVYATIVSGIYDKDPAIDPSAKLLKRVSVSELRKILVRQNISAGRYELIDPIALSIIERSRIKVTVIDGRDPTTILKAVRGEDVGTLVIHDHDK
jgi:uridylate kinase